VALTVLGQLRLGSRPEEHMIIEALDEIFETAPIFEPTIG
jgi:hypothetical protein